ncbi:MAG: mechanosensitive ion channel family protein [Burkholderiales bacterium]
MKDALAYFRELDAEAQRAAITALRVVVILALAWILQALANRLIRIFRRYMQAKAPSADEQARIDTLARVFRNSGAIIIVIVAGTLVLGELGISIAPILATAGVAGVAIGFGAQSLIKDYFTGFFLLLEDQLRQGDVVEVAGKGGLVEEVTLRHVRLRDMEGHVHYIPNGEIKLVTNRTRAYATPVVDIGVAYRENIEDVFALMREAAAELRADPQWRERVVDDLEIVGVERWGDSAVTLRARFKVVPPIQQWNVKREYLKRLKTLFDARGVEIPFPHLTVYAGQNKDGSAPPFHLLETKAAKIE